ncbi:unnamed protein product [Ceutorhynchus assimilis]|uniref:RHD domain-containing protein n=1 Tax=Ceutorhynchus assimilis TaxID=467358 RepID=A0A9N9QS41_9CUCU|nr:unnamed protein product [Ceutorhynchus assimilis]
MSYSDATHLAFVEQPANKFPFRYKSEKLVTHDCLKGLTSDGTRKPNYPTVEVIKEIRCHPKTLEVPWPMIRCSIYNIIKEDFNPHSHKLVVEYGRGEIEDPLHLRVGPVERMPRTRQRKTERGKKDLSIYKQAYSEVTNDGLSIRAAAKKYDLCHVSLMRYGRKTTTIEEAKVSMGFGGMGIIHTPRRNIVEELVKKMSIQKEELIARCEGMRRALTANEIKEVIVIF